MKYLSKFTGTKATTTLNETLESIKFVIRIFNSSVVKNMVEAHAIVPNRLRSQFENAIANRRHRLSMALKNWKENFDKMSK